MDKYIWLMEYKRAFGMYTGFIVLASLLTIFCLHGVLRVTNEEKGWCNDAEDNIR